ncbi:hypothetical protein [Streptomyces dysideae]|uniref:Uncharacterized protein n=1 Tax=Streptomyces dysideae TaxID=909626 RepID=A0A101V398_9ACTN|nr:hypothetical protein [Streptomyces dysideae]KUO21674.1 hypothetical protein AQJ91_07810 [Streptomyces dysideae]
MTDEPQQVIAEITQAARAHSSLHDFATREPLLRLLRAGNAEKLAVSLANEILALWNRPPITETALEGDLGPALWPSTPPTRMHPARVLRDASSFLEMYFLDIRP